MIILNFTHSPDQSALGKITMNVNEFTIGNALNNQPHIYIDDPDMPSKHLTISFKDRNYLVRSNGNHVLKNGKKFIGVQKLNPQDVITFGKTSFEVEINIKESAPFNFEEAYHKAIDQDPELASIFDGIKREIIILERDRNES